MFDVSFPELVLIAIVGLLVIGPKRLPEALRTLGLWIGRMRRSFNNVRAEIEKEIGMDEIRRQLHNEAVMDEMKRIERDVRDSVNSVSKDLPNGPQRSVTEQPESEPIDSAEPAEAPAPASPSKAEEDTAAASPGAAKDARHG